MSDISQTPDGEEAQPYADYYLADDQGRCVICLHDIEGSHGAGAEHGVDFCYGCMIDCGAAFNAGLRLFGWLHQTATSGPPMVERHIGRDWRRNSVSLWKLCDGCSVVLVPAARITVPEGDDHD